MRAVAGMAPDARCRFPRCDHPLSSSMIGGVGATCITEPRRLAGLPSWCNSRYPRQIGKRKDTGLASWFNMPGLITHRRSSLSAPANVTPRQSGFTNQPQVPRQILAVGKRTTLFYLNQITAVIPQGASHVSTNCCRTCGPQVYLGNMMSLCPHPESQSLDFPGI
jgi:hypothetical protein